MAFFIFHLRVGIRLAMRKLALVLAIFFAVNYLFRPELFSLIITASTLTGSFVTGFFSAVIILSIAGMASRRICLGLNGWIRHLPASSLMIRRLAGISIFVALLPVLIVLAFLALYAQIKFGVSTAAYLAGLPLLGLASALYVLPVKRRIITRPLAALSCVSLGSGYLPFIFGGTILLVVTDLMSGPLSPTRRPLIFRNAFRGSLMSVTIAWRALRLRIFIPYVLALGVMGATSLFISNNSLNISLTVKAVRFGGVLSIVLFCATVSNMLSARRLPWPWARSLPWSARERIVLDSFFISLLIIPILILVAWMNSKAVFPVAVSLPVLALFSSYAIRRAPECRAGASGIILCFGMLAALSITLIPLLSFVFLALTPLALKYAVEGEQSQKVSRWLELHHLAAGDSLSWSKE